MMASDMTVYMIIGCLAFIAVLFFSKPLVKIVKILIQGIIGALGIYMLNFVLLPFNISIGVNLVTVIYIGILGIPGFVSLYALGLIL